MSNMMITSRSGNGQLRQAFGSGRRLLAAVALAAATLSMGGCQLAGFVAASAERSGSKDVKAKYTGLKGKTFAVIVAADRAIQSDHPDTVAVVTAEVTRRVSIEGPTGPNAAGVVSAADVLTFQGRRPGWVAMTPTELVKELGVDRLIYIDIDEYRLTDPGNRYVWNGVASGIVGVVEAETDLIEEFVFREHIQVKFPDKENTGPMEIPENTVRLALLKRFVDRCSWLFLDHVEANIIEY